jgi:hypothetical protein
LQFRHCGRNIFQSNEPKRYKPLQVMAAIVDCPIVEGAETGGPELGIV